MGRQPFSETYVVPDYETFERLVIGRAPSSLYGELQPTQWCEALWFALTSDDYQTRRYAVEFVDTRKVTNKYFRTDAAIMLTMTYPLDPWWKIIWGFIVIWWSDLTGRWV